MALHPVMWKYSLLAFPLLLKRQRRCRTICRLIYYDDMPEGERKSHIPPLDEQERLSDMTWLNENLPVFWSMAQSAYEEVGRGALVTDLTVQFRGGGHPIAYCSQELIVAVGDPDAIRMVEQYEPDWQFVTMLFKTGGRISTYRIGVHNQIPSS